MAAKDAKRNKTKKAKTAVPIDPSVKPLIESLAGQHKRDQRWKLILNEQVEVDF